MSLKDSTTKSGMVKLNLDHCDVIPAASVDELGPHYRSAKEFFVRQEPLKDGDLVVLKGNKGRRQLKSINLVGQEVMLSSLDPSQRSMMVPLKPMDKVIVTSY